MAIITAAPGTPQERPDLSDYISVKQKHWGLINAYPRIPACRQAQVAM